MDLDYTAIGVRVRRLRKELGYTQQFLAELSGQEPSNISHIERGATKLSLPTIVALSNALGVTVDALLCDSLVEAREPYAQELADLLSDCSHWERKILTETLRSLKSSLRNNK